MRKFGLNMLAASAIFAMWCGVALAQNLSVRIFKSDEYEGGYVRIGLDAFEAFEIAYSYFKEHKGDSKDYESVFYAIKDNTILITFLKAPVHLDGNEEFKVLLDRTTLKILNKS